MYAPKSAGYLLLDISAYFYLGRFLKQHHINMVSMSRPATIEKAAIGEFEGFAYCVTVISISGLVTPIVLSSDT